MAAILPDPDSRHHDGLGQHSAGSKSTQLTGILRCDERTRDWELAAFTRGAG